MERAIEIVICWYNYVLNHQSEGIYILFVTQLRPISSNISYNNPNTLHKSLTHLCPNSVFRKFSGLKLFSSTDL